MIKREAFFLSVLVILTIHINTLLSGNLTVTCLWINKTKPTKTQPKHKLANEPVVCELEPKTHGCSYRSSVTAQRWPFKLRHLNTFTAKHTLMRKTPRQNLCRSSTDDKAMMTVTRYNMMFVHSAPSVWTIGALHIPNTHMYIWLCAKTALHFSTGTL